MPSNVIRIAFIADRGYLPHAAALLDSMLAHHAPRDVELHLLCGPDLPQQDRSVLEQWLDRRGQALRVHTIPPESLAAFPDLHFPRAVWYRILLPDLLPDVAKILYVDADTLVLDELRPLWEMDITAHLFAAVTNPLYPFMHGGPILRLGLPDPGRYINSGVLLLNLDAMRRADCISALREYARRHPENPYPEQDALSALFHEQCLLLHPRWNVQTTFFDLEPSELPFTAEQTAEAREHPAIVHFIGPFKPDHYLSRHPYGNRYLAHRRNTPWPVSAVRERTPVNLILRRLPMAWQYRYFVLRARWNARRMTQRSAST